MINNLTEIRNKLFPYIEINRDIEDCVEILDKMIHKNLELEVGEKFKLRIHKSDTNMEKEYEVFRKCKDIYGMIEYWFYNDCKKASVIYNNDFIKI